MFTIQDAVRVANELGIVFDKFSIKDLITGLNIDNLEESDFEALTENLDKLHYLFS